MMAMSFAYVYVLMHRATNIVLTWFKTKFMQFECILESHKWSSKCSKGAFVLKFQGPVSLQAENYFWHFCGAKFSLQYHTDILQYISVFHAMESFHLLIY